MKNPPSESHDPHLVPLGKLSDGYVVLPYNEAEFRDFIESLLGSPQAITRAWHRPFEIGFDAVRDLHQLVLQRLSQNGGSLARFDARIGFSDDSAVELRTIEELLTYNEIRDIASNSLLLLWDFLVKFPGKTTPEKQSIQISFWAGEKEFPEYDTSSEPQFLRQITFGGISVRIEHTSRTWGTDIDALMSQHIGRLFVRIHPVREWCRKRSGWVGIGLASVVGTMVVMTLERWWQLVDAKRSLDVVAHFATTSTPTLTDAMSRLNYLGNLISQNDPGRVWTNRFWEVGVMLMATVALSFAIAHQFGKTRPSFVLLSRRASVDRDALLKKIEKRWWVFAGAGIVTLCLGIASNWLFRAFF
jgi:hypothetical protein